MLFALHSPLAGVTGPSCQVARGNGLECRAGRAYSFPMDDTPYPMDAPPGWAEALDESLAELAAGVPTVPSALVRRDLLDSIARMEAKRADVAKRKTTARR